MPNLNDVLGIDADAPVIDVDTHLTEPPTLWTDHAPAKYRDRVPHVEVLDGKECWIFDGDLLGRAGSSSAVDVDGNKKYGLSFIEDGYPEISAAAWQIDARLAHMDEHGIHAAIVYPNTVGFGGQKFMDCKDEELRLVTIQAYNDYSAAMQEESGQRLFGIAITPWWDLDLTIKELHRCAAMGIRGVNLGTGPHLHGMADLGERFWDPLWETVAELELPVNFHIGASSDTMSWFGSSPWPSHDMDTKLGIGSAMMYLSNASVMANLIFSGVCERHPDVQFVSVESGVGWIPFFLQSLDYQQVQSMPGTLGTKFSLTPTEYFQRQMYGCFWFEDAGLASAVAALGDDRVMFETDFPHPTCLYPDSANLAGTALSQLAPESRRKVMSDNAMGLYRIPAPVTA
ncbi:MAG: amidohydrolase family protein [Acidimicrobiia bacterium]